MLKAYNKIICCEWLITTKLNATKNFQIAVKGIIRFDASSINSLMAIVKDLVLNNKIM